MGGVYVKNNEVSWFLLLTYFKNHASWLRIYCDIILYAWCFRCLLDDDDEVRDRATFYLTVLQEQQKALNSAYILNGRCQVFSLLWYVTEEFKYNNGYLSFCDPKNGKYFNIVVMKEWP